MASDCTEPYTNRDKWVVSLIIALVALLMFSPFNFSVLNVVAAKNPFFPFLASTENGAPSLAGLVIVTTVFFLIVRLIFL